MKAKKAGQNRPAIERGTFRKKASKAQKGRSNPVVADPGGKFKMFLDAAADAIVIFNNEGMIFYWNGAAEKLFGYKAKEVVGTQLDIIIPERYRDDYKNGLETLKEQKRLRPINQFFESEAVKRTGKEFPIAASVSTAQIDGVQYYIGIGRDISALRSAQNALGDSLAKYQMMYESQRDGIILVDMETQQFLEANRAATEMYGYSKGEMLKMRIVDIFTEADKGARLSPESTNDFNIFKHKRKDGTIFPAEMTGCVLLWRNRKTFCAIVRDASDESHPGK